MSQRERDWVAVVDRLVNGDPTALVELSRLITGFLRCWRAYDLRNEWDDLVQEVLVVVAKDFATGRLREQRAAAAYIRTVTRRRFIDVIRRVRPDFIDHDPDELREAEHEDELASLLLERVNMLPEKQKRAVEAVYLEGRTQQEAAAETGIPVGSLKRYLREALARLRVTMAAS